MKNLALKLLFLAALCAFPAFAASVLPPMIYSDGRIKPMDSFARNALYQMSGKTSVGGIGASGWVERIVLHAPGTDAAPLFRVNRAEVNALLHLDPAVRYHAYKEIVPARGLLEEYAERTDAHPVTVEMRHLSDAVTLYEQLWGAEDYKRIPNVDPHSERVLARAENDVWRVYPDPTGDSAKLVSAWVYIAEGMSVMMPATPSPELQKKLNLEIAYHRVNLPLWAFALAACSAVLALLALGFRRKILWNISAVFLSLCGCSLIAALVWRILIVHRAPMASLYEILLLVAFLLVQTLVLLLVCAQARRLFALGAVLETALLFFAVACLAGGDTFRSVSAVLNSSFWLTLHVFTIAVGYTGMFLAGLAGHAALLGNIFRGKNPQNDEVRKDAGVSDKLIYGTFAAGAFFTICGTLLGGFWADVAWGRFWGWDPKENAALFVILWAMLAFHLRAAKLIKPFMFAVLAALSLPVVGFSWFGVNLLGAGLHSYGFENGTAIAVAGFVIADAAVIAGLAAFAARRQPNFIG